MCCKAVASIWFEIREVVDPGKQNFDFSGQIILIFQAKLAIYSWANYSISLQKSLLSNILPVHDKIIFYGNKCLGNALDKLQLIARQDALLILRHSRDSPRLMHVLRSTPCQGYPRLGDFDELLRAGLERILNASLTDDQ